MSFPTPVQPPKRSLHPFASGLEAGLTRHHVVEGHGNICPQLPLDFDSSLGCERAQGAVDMALELDPVLLDPAKTFERKHLKATRVGEHGSVPGGKAVQAAHGLHHRLSGPQVQVVRVAQDDLGTGAANVLCAESPHDTVRAYRNECGSLNCPVGKIESSCA